MESTPISIGDTVHYKAYGTPNGEFTPECRAAIVTEISAPEGIDGMTPLRIGVAVLNPTGLFFQTNLPESTSWHRREDCDPNG